MRQQNQTQHQTQAQQQTQQTQLYFVTFATKLDPETAKQILTELRKRFPSQKAVFTPVPPSGKKKFVTINEILVIITFPYTPKNQNRQEIHNQSSTQGFTVAELIKNKP